MALFLDLLDQLRYIVGLLAAIFILCHRALIHRENYPHRLALSGSVMLAAALAYVPLKALMAPYMAAFPIVTAPYWLIMSLLPVGVVLLVYETNVPGALFRVMMASFAENIVTVLIRYLLVLDFFPTLPERHTALYLLIMLAVYSAFYYAMERTLGEAIARDESELYPKSRAAVWVYLISYLAYLAILGTTKMVSENIILPIADDPTLMGVFYFLRYFLTALMLLLSFIMSVMMWYLYDRLSIQNEKQILVQMAKDRQSQYEFSRENIEMINRKSHDLKHTLRALERVSDEERLQRIRETRKAIDFYDAVVKTGNEALDTLLTEKSVYCANRNIRLSCMVNTARLQKIGLVDLYTLLGNALDNAIESADRLSNGEKKVISLSIRDKGELLFFQIENYYEGEVEIRDGFPVTSKEDRENHGYGEKSIQNIAKHYGGDIMIQAENGIFALEIVIPT